MRVRMVLLIVISITTTLLSASSCGAVVDYAQAQAQIEQAQALQGLAHVMQVQALEGLCGMIALGLITLVLAGLLALAYLHNVRNSGSMQRSILPDNRYLPVATDYEAELLEAGDMQQFGDGDVLDVLIRSWIEER